MPAATAQSGFEPLRLPSFLVPEAIARQANIPKGAALLYGRMARFTSKGGTCYASVEYLARELRVSDRSIERWIAALVKARLVKREWGEHRGKVTVFLPFPPPGAPCQLPLVENSMENLRADARGPDSTVGSDPPKLAEAYKEEVLDLDIGTHHRSGATDGSRARLCKTQSAATIPGAPAEQLSFTLVETAPLPAPVASVQTRPDPPKPEAQSIARGSKDVQVADDFLIAQIAAMARAKTMRGLRGGVVNCHESLTPYFSTGFDGGPGP